MTQSAYANSIVNIMLGWLKGFAGWVLKLFDLAGRGGVSPLAWLSDNWLNLLIFFIILGVVIDWLVWFMRWRPYWVWFRRKRILIEDDDFFAGEQHFDSGLYGKKDFSRELEGKHAARGRIEKDAEEDDWEEEFVVASTVVRRSSSKNDDRDIDGTEPKKPRRKREIDWDSDWDEDSHEPARKRRTGSAPKRAHADREDPRKKKFRTDEPARKTLKGSAKSRPAQKKNDHAAGDLFDLEQNDPSAASFWEDDVFNIENLPGAETPVTFENGGTDGGNAALEDKLS